MKKKTVKKKKPTKQKIDVVLESLLNLETQVKKLIVQIDQLRYGQSSLKGIKIDPNKITWNPPEYN